MRARLTPRFRCARRSLVPRQDIGPSSLAHGLQFIFASHLSPHDIIRQDNMLETIIRPARPRDRASWLRLRRSLWPRCSDHKHRLEMAQLAKSGGIVLVAENSRGRLIGFAEVSLRHDHVDGASICPVPYLEAWFVEPSFRKRGLGRLLIDAVEHWAGTRGYTELASDALIENTLSISLHKRLGFSEIDRNVTFLKALSRGKASRYRRT